MKNIIMSIVYLFYKVFIISKIKVPQINCSWSKAPSKAALEQWADGIENRPVGGSPARLGSRRSYPIYPEKSPSAGETWLTTCSPYGYMKTNYYQEDCHIENCYICQEQAS